MATTSQNIKNTIISDLAKITTSNGYDITIEEVKDKATLITEVNNYPSAFVLLGTDKIGEELEENEIRYLDIIIGVHCNIDDDDKIIGSLLKHFQQDTSIIDDYWTSLDTIDGIINLSVVEKNYNINWHNNKKTVGILLNVKYYQELRTVSSGVNIITPPSILDGYSLKSHTHSIINNDLEINGTLTSNDIYLTGQMFAYDDNQEIYKRFFVQGDSEIYLGSTENEFRIFSKDSDNANIYLNNNPIGSIFSSTGHTHSIINNDLKVNGTLSANQLYFTSTTAVELTVTGQELNFLGSVSITGDNVLPTANHLLQTYKPNETTPCFLVTSGGNVGIGTTSPGSKLNIVDSSNTLLKIRTNSGSINETAGILFGVAASDTQQAGIFFERLGGSAEGNLYFATKASGATNVDKSNARMTVDSNGNVGIGTTAAGVNLHIVKGNGTLPTTAGETLILQNNTNTTDVSSLSLLAGVAGSSRINFGDANDIDIGRLIYDHSANKFFFSYDSAEKMTIDIVNGYVGIGTTSPTRLLHVNSATNNYIRLQATGSDTYVGYEMTNDAQGWTAGVNNNDDYVINDGLQFGGENIITVQNGTPVNTLYIKDTGNIGINTTVPSQTLDVNGNIAVGLGTIGGGLNYGSTGSASYGTIIPYNGSANMTFTSAYVNAGAPTNGGINFATGGTNTKVRINQDGNVGINTSTPTEKLSVSGNISVTGNMIVNGLTGYSGTITASQVFTVTNGIITSVL